MNKEELETYAKAQKEKYMAADLALGVKRMQDLDRMILKDERDLLGENNYTDEEIEEIIKSRTYLMPEDYKNYDKLYNPYYMSNHPMMTLGIDLKEICEHIRKNEHETLVYVAIDGNSKILGCVIEKGEDANIGSETIQKASRRLICEYPKAKEVVMLHNHPHVVAAIASSMDGRMAMQAKIAFEMFGINLIDDCVVTEADFYSRRRDESEKEGSYDRVYSRILPEDLRKEIKRVNPNLGGILL